MFENRSSNAGTKLVLRKFLLVTCQGSIQNKPSSFRIFQSESCHVNSGSDDVNQKFLPVPAAVLFGQFPTSPFTVWRGRKCAVTEKVILDR